jgi:hypothetical protein
VAQYLCNEVLRLARFQRIVAKIRLLASPVLYVRLSACKNTIALKECAWNRVTLVGVVLEFVHELKRLFKTGQEQRLFFSEDRHALLCACLV